MVIILLCFILQDLVHADDEGIGVNYAKEWNTKRTIVLNRYTTGEKLTIVSSFLPGGEKSKCLSLIPNGTVLLVVCNLFNFVGYTGCFA